MYKGDKNKGEIEIIRSLPIYSNKYIEINNDEVMFPSGAEGTYIRVSGATPKSVAVLPVTQDGKIVLIKTFRHGMRGWAYEVPKGGIEEGESSKEAAFRELTEETGYYSDKLVYLGEYAESPAIFNSKLKLYFALNCYKNSDINSEPTEAITGTELFSPQAFLENDVSLDFKDAVTELVLFKYLFNKERDGDL